MELDPQGKEIVTIYHWTTFAGRVRVYEGKATVEDNYGETVYVITERHEYLGSAGNRIYRDENTNTDKKVIYRAAINRTKKNINNSLENIAKSMASMKTFERILHAT